MQRHTYKEVLRSWSGDRHTHTQSTCETQQLKEGEYICCLVDVHPMPEQYQEAVQVALLAGHEAGSEAILYSRQGRSMSDKGYEWGANLLGIKREH